MWDPLFELERPTSQLWTNMTHSISSVLNRVRRVPHLLLLCWDFFQVWNCADPTYAVITIMIQMCHVTFTTVFTLEIIHCLWLSQCFHPPVEKLHESWKESMLYRCHIMEKHPTVFFLFFAYWLIVGLYNNHSLSLVWLRRDTMIMENIIKENI